MHRGRPHFLRLCLDRARCGDRELVRLHEVDCGLFGEPWVVRFRIQVI